MTCRDEILECIHQITSRRPDVEFGMDEVLRCMRKKKSKYAESTIRTHVASRMCGNAPDNHGVVYNDIKRVGPNRYQPFHR